jgi:hypothetical protein
VLALCAFLTSFASRATTNCWIRVTAMVCAMIITVGRSASVFLALRHLAYAILLKNHFLILR